METAYLKFHQTRIFLKTRKDRHAKFVCCRRTERRLSHRYCGVNQMWFILLVLTVNSCKQWLAFLLCVCDADESTHQSLVCLLLRLAQIKSHIRTSIVIPHPLSSASYRRMSRCDFTVCNSFDHVQLVVHVISCTQSANLLLTQGLFQFRSEKSRCCPCALNAAYNPHKF